MKLSIYISIGISLVREARTNAATFLDTRRKLSSSDVYFTIVTWLPSRGTRISPGNAQVAEFSGTTIYMISQMEIWMGIFTPTNVIPVLSENDANCSVCACIWSAKASLISLMVWLPGNKSLTNFLSEKLTSSNTFNIFARSAPRWGVPRNAIRQCFSWFDYTSNYCVQLSTTRSV